MGSSEMRCDRCCHRKYLVFYSKWCGRAQCWGIGCRSIGTHSATFNKSPSSNAGQWILTIPLFLCASIWLRIGGRRCRRTKEKTYVPLNCGRKIFIWRPGDDAEQPKIEKKKNIWNQSPYRAHRIGVSHARNENISYWLIEKWPWKWAAVVVGDCVHPMRRART